MVSGERPSAPIVGFYGWKGGTGRTLLVANMAVGLALEGRRVLAIDLDLEAPGLGDYFDRYVRDDLTRRTGKANASTGADGRSSRDTDGATARGEGHAFLGKGGWRSRPGFLDILNADADMETMAAQVAELCRQPAVVESEGGQIPKQQSSVLQFLGPMQRPGSERYAYGMLQADWDRFFATHGGRAIEALLPVLKPKFDIILVDLRTGLSQFTFQIYARMLDKLVMVTVPTHQAARGISTAADVFAYNRPEVPKFVVLSDLHVDRRVEGTGSPRSATSAGSELDATGMGNPFLSRSADAVISLALHRLLEAEQRAGPLENNIDVAERLFRLPRLDTQQGEEKLLYTVPAPTAAQGGRGTGSIGQDARHQYCVEGNRIAAALFGPGWNAFDDGKLTAVTPNERNPTPGVDFSEVSARDDQPQRIVEAIVRQASGAIKEYVKGYEEDNADHSQIQVASQTSRIYPEETLREALEASYPVPADGEPPFGVRPLLAARLAQPYLSRAYHNGVEAARPALEALGLDVLEKNDVETVHAANVRFVEGIPVMEGTSKPELPKLQEVEDPEAGAGADSGARVGQGDSANGGGQPADGEPAKLAPENIAAALAQAAGDSRHPWRALADLSKALEGGTIPPPFDLRVSEVRISLLSNAEDHLGALEELLALPEAAEGRAVLKALESNKVYAAQLNRTIQSAFSPCLDAIAVSDQPKGQEDQLGTISAGLDRLEKLNQGITFQQIIGRYRGALAALNDPAKLGAEDGLANSAGSAPAKGQQSEFDGFFHESVGKVPPSTLREIPVDLARLDPPEQAFVHSACGRPTEAYGARLRAARAAHRPNEPVSDNPRQVTALRDLGVMAARAGAVEPALTQFTDLLDAIPDLYTEEATRNDSWVEEDIQYERRLLLLYRAHCHWLAGDLKAAREDIAAAHCAHRRYAKARDGQRFWAIRPLPAFQVMLEARIAFESGQYSTALEKSERLIPIYRAQAPIDGVPAVERLAGLHRLRARAYRALGRTEEANQALEASLNAANLAPPGNPGPDADRAEAELLQLCWGEAPDAGAVVAAFNKAREAINQMVRFELPDGFLEGPHQSSFQARAVTLAIDCLKANAACALQGEADKLIKGMETVALLKPLCERLRKQLEPFTPTSETTTA